jgi:catechol 2,3-dioxygenase-like lactoylglutathione lyase family enzyme
MSTAPPIVPELDVADLARSLSFYVDGLGFSVRIERPEEQFVYLTRGPVHLMLEQADGPGRRFRTAPLEYPFGRGMNLQIEVPDVDHLHTQALKAGAAIDIPLEERWYRQGDKEASSLTQMAISFASSRALANGKLHSRPRPGDLQRSLKRTGFGRSMAEGV